ncbi:hypothetical protein V2S04_07350 [Microbacterium sp. OR21]|uniref:hypothetical protein n=1 Tax=Microbacterium sp. OR21 TaxID=3095346 RepID=UPI0039B5495B
MSVSELTEERAEQRDDGLQSFELAASELDPGMTILVGVNGGTLLATIGVVEVDPDNEGCTRLTFTTESGEARMSSCPDDDAITILLDAAA